MNDITILDHALRSSGLATIDPDLVERVQAALYLKRQGLDSVPIDLEAMKKHFNASGEDLVKIIRWYEGELLSTKFEVR